MAQTLRSLKKPKAAPEKKSGQLLITRIFDAPREMVWNAWTRPDLVMRWWGPKNYTAPAIQIDLRVGGRYLYCMRSPEGKDYWSTGRFREIAPQKRLILTDSFSDEKGNIVPASYYDMSGDWPLELEVKINFEEQRNKTRLSVLYEHFPAGDVAGLAGQGWNESLDKLGSLLAEQKTAGEPATLIAEPGRQEATMIRVLDAPRERVFKALTDPKLIEKWWAPRRFTIIVDKMDLRPGGSWRFLNRDAEGNEYAFHGVYHEISPARIVSTWEYEGMPGHVLLGIWALEEEGGKTKFTSKSIFESVEDRDAMLKTGMEEGGRETMDRLAELVKET